MRHYGITNQSAVLFIKFRYVNYAEIINQALKKHRTSQSYMKKNWHTLKFPRKKVHLKLQMRVLNFEHRSEKF